MIKTTTKRAVFIYAANFMLAYGVYTASADKDWSGLVFLVVGLYYRIIGEGYVGGPQDD